MAALPLAELSALASLSLLGNNPLNSLIRVCLVAVSISHDIVEAMHVDTCTVTVVSKCLFVQITFNI